MGGWRWLVRRLQVLFGKDEAEREMDEEIRALFDSTGPVAGVV